MAVELLLASLPLLQFGVEAVSVCGSAFGFFLVDLRGRPCGSSSIVQPDRQHATRGHAFGETCKWECDVTAFVICQDSYLTVDLVDSVVAC
jgi:hypothetical protein